MIRDPMPVSVIVPTHNGEATLPALLESLRRLDYPAEALEVIVVDNRSTDASPAIVARFPEARLVRQPRPGAYAARNAGLAVARGQILAFTDDDCQVDRAWVRQAVACFADPAVGVVAGRILPRGAQGGVERYLADKREHDPGRTFKPDHPPWAAGGNAFYRRAVFDQLGPFDADMISGGDVEMSWRAQLRAGWKLVLCPSAIVWHNHASTLADLFRQQKRYGMGRVQIHQRLPEVQPFEGFGEWYWRWRLLLAGALRLAADYRKLSAGRGWRAFVESADVLRLLQRLGYNWGRLCGSLKFRTLYP